MPNEEVVLTVVVELVREELVDVVTCEVVVLLTTLLYSWMALPPPHSSVEFPGQVIEHELAVPFLELLLRLLPQ